MPITDFTERTWKIISSDDLDKLKPGTPIVISETGVDGAVNISIGDGESMPGRYIETTNKIVVGNTGIGLRITYEAVPGGGSWTAEDSPSGPPE